MRCSRKASSIVFVPPRSRPTRRQNAVARRLKWVNAHMSTFVYLKKSHANFRCASLCERSHGEEEKDESSAARCFRPREFPKYFAVIRASKLFRSGGVSVFSPKRARFNLYFCFFLCVQMCIFVLTCARLSARNDDASMMHKKRETDRRRKKCRKCGRRMVAVVEMFVFFFFARESVQTVARRQII